MVKLTNLASAGHSAASTYSSIADMDSGWIRKSEILGIFQRMDAKASPFPCRQSAKQEQGAPTD